MFHKYTVEALSVCIARGVSVTLWGDPGAGKTSVINQISNSYNLWLETVIASIREPSDFSGLPVVRENSMYLAPPSWAKNIVERDQQGQRSVLFYDEISTAPESVQAALLRPILEGVVGGLRLPQDVITVAAANPPEIAAGGWEMSAPIANRFLHLDWEPDAEFVKNGFINGFPTVEVPSFPKNITMKEKQAKAIVGYFIGSKPDLLSRVPENFGLSKGKFKAHSYGFPTSRAWETVARIYAACVSGKFMSDGRPIGKMTLELMIKGVVGEAAAVAFLSYVKNLDLQNPNAILEGVEDVIIPNRADQATSLLIGLEHIFQLNPTPELWERYGDALSLLHGSNYADLAYSYSKRWLTDLRPEGCLPSNQHKQALSGIMNELQSR